MEQNYRISFQVGDAKFEIESTDQEWIEKKEKQYLEKIFESAKKGREPKGMQILPKEEIRGTAIPQNLTINEFYQKYIKGKKVTSRPNIAVFFVYYLQKILKRDNIKTQDVTQCFADISYILF
jgi:hypothetical protein